MTEEITQGSDAWHQMRLGKITASRIANIMTKVKSGESAYRKRAKFEIIRERLTGRRIESYKTALMQRGIDLEPLARAKYVSKMKIRLKIGMAIFRVRLFYLKVLSLALLIISISIIIKQKLAIHI
jgi:hypothetical protein